ncbi:MAG: IclR family transcriptional regulator [Anaerolineaceae bacterium]|nr:IclR family transcriptional regulator [Anaerolineaceae bacterium]
MKQATPSSSKATIPQGAVQSVSRALDLLEVFLQHGPEIGLTRIATLLSLDKATAYRLLSTLEDRGYVERSPDSRNYRLGLRAFELGSYYQNQLEVRKLALVYMKEMVAQTQEAAFLCVSEEDAAVCVERVEGEYQVNIFGLRVGGKQPLHWGAAPRALLSGMSDAELAAYAARTGLPAATPYTLTTLDQLIEDARCTRRQGYTVSINDATIGIAAVGAPVYDHRSRVVASVSLSGLTHRYAPERMGEIARVITAAAEKFSRQLGYITTR